jgi:hypothetical protein
VKPMRRTNSARARYATSLTSSTPAWASSMTVRNYVTTLLTMPAPHRDVVLGAVFRPLHRLRRAAERHSLNPGSSTSSRQEGCRYDAELRVRGDTFANGTGDLLSQHEEGGLVGDVESYLRQLAVVVESANTASGTAGIASALAEAQRVAPGACDRPCTLDSSEVSAGGSSLGRGQDR